MDTNILAARTFVAHLASALIKRGFDVRTKIRMSPVLVDEIRTPYVIVTAEVLTEDGKRAGYERRFTMEEVHAFHPDDVGREFVEELSAPS